MAQSRYLFAISCFRMDFLNEAEAALSPPNEPSAEVVDNSYSGFIWELFLDLNCPYLGISFHNLPSFSWHCLCYKLQ